MKNILLRSCICIFVLAFTLYSYIDQQNELTQLRLSIPVVALEVKELREENTRLEYEIDLFESPEHLIHLANRSEFSHLKHPPAKEVLVMAQGPLIQEMSQEAKDSSPLKPKLTLAVGAK